MQRNQSGFTLLEVLMALVVISLSSICLAEMISGANRAWARAEAISHASALVQEVMAYELLKTKFEDLKTPDFQQRAAARNWTLRVSRKTLPELNELETIRVAVSGGDLPKTIQLSHAVRRKF